LLLQPFLAAAVLCKRWDWALVPALIIVVLGFLMREPLVTLGRQRWVWRERKPESGAAAKWLAGESAAALLFVVGIWPRLAHGEFLALSAAAAAITLAAVWMTVKNRQRSMVLQGVSAAGLSLSAPFAALVVLGNIPAWAWWLWLILSMHGIASILVVHARLKLRAGASGEVRGPALLGQCVQILTAAVLLLLGPASLAAPMGFSSVVNCAELRRLSPERAASERLQRVGFRALAASIVHAAITVAALWARA
jgi:hypothetical protein